jgi:hypothetical protein
VSYNAEDVIAGEPRSYVDERGDGWRLSSTVGAVTEPAVGFEDAATLRLWRAGRRDLFG